tara:strand:- start:27 stop:866 length:840 start_codon:yes stop_codon:yes gene_type:complete
MRFKNKDICVYILYLFIILLIILIIHYSYKILYKNKIEHFDNTINYLDHIKTIEFLNKDHDNYIKHLSRFDLIARNVDSNNQYINQICNCVKNFTQNQKNIINNCCIKADEFLNQYHDLLDGKEIAKIKWNFALTDKYENYEYENGLPHTRSNIIFLSDKMIPETETPDFINTLIHEKIHVYQRQNESIIDNVLSDKLKINKVVHSNTKKRANPDLNRNTYKNPNNEIMQCYYNSDNPNSIQDVTCLHNNSVNEHPYEFLAYTIANKYNDYLIKKYINI